MNNNGQIVRYEGTFSPENTIITSVEDEKSQEEILLYPNPSSGIISISSQQKSITKITAYNILGSEIKTFYPQERTNYEIDMSDSPSGCYFIAIETDNNKIVKRIIIK